MVLLRSAGTWHETYMDAASAASVSADPVLSAPYAIG